MLRQVLLLLPLVLCSLVACDREQASTAADADGAEKPGPEPSAAKAEPSAAEPSAAKPKPSPAGTTPSAAPDPAIEAAVETATGPSFPSELEAPKAMPMQRGFRAHTAEFLGWTEDGNRFVIESGYGLPIGEMPDHVRVVQVHDALTGLALERYLIEDTREGSDFPRDAKNEQLVKRSKSKKKWKKRKAELGLVGAEARREGPGGGYSVELSSDWEAPKGTKWTVDDTKGRYTLKVGDADGMKFLAKGMPAVQVELVSAGGKARVLDSAAPLIVDEELREQFELGSVVRGRVEAFWSPTGERVLLLNHGKFESILEGSEAWVGTAWFVRGLGPQVRVVAAGAEEGAARASVAALHELGVPVASLDPKGKAVPASEVYYRDGGKASAELIAKALGGLPVAALDDEGWVQVIVLVAG